MVLISIHSAYELMHTHSNVVYHEPSCLTVCVCSVAATRDNQQCMMVCSMRTSLSNMSVQDKM